MERQRALPHQLAASGSGSGRPAAHRAASDASSGSAAQKSAEDLRSAHIRTLEVLAELKKENAALQKQVHDLEKLARGHERMKPEELDSLYVEERRLIESLEQQVFELKAGQAGVRKSRDADVAAAQAETRRLKEEVKELREAQRRAAQLSSSQLDKIRTAFQAALDEKAAECEQAKVYADELRVECGLERSRADSSERRLSELRAQLAAQAPAPAADDEDTRALLRQAEARVDAMSHSAERAKERAERNEQAAQAARHEAAEGRAALAEAKASAAEVSARLQKAEAALEEERRKLRDADASTKATLSGQARAARAREDDLAREIARLTKLVEEARAELAKAPKDAALSDDGRSVFTDFVALKRELGTLKEENASLRRRLSGLAPSGRTHSAMGPPPAASIDVGTLEPPEPMGSILERHRQLGAPAEAPAATPFQAAMRAGGGRVAPSSHPVPIAAQKQHLASGGKNGGAIAGAFAVGRRSALLSEKGAGGAANFSTRSGGAVTVKLP
jgi:DNA repair exonuclease SbcCD ATPase subunit